MVVPESRSRRTSSQSRARLWEEVRRLRKGGTTVFLTTHYLEEADALCDRLAIIDHGKIVAEGSPDELKRQVAGDVVTVGVGGHQDDALRLFQAQTFVREAGAEEDGTIRRVATAAADPEKHAALEELSRAYPPGPGSRQPARLALESSGVVHFPEFTPESLRETTRDEHHYELMTKLDPRSAIATVPSGRIAGADQISL